MESYRNLIYVRVLLQGADLQPTNTTGTKQKIIRFFRNNHAYAQDRMCTFPIVLPDNSIDSSRDDESSENLTPISPVRESAGGGALERGLLSNPRPPDLSNQIMSPALWFPFRGLTKLSHPGKKARARSTAKKHWPKKD